MRRSARAPRQAVARECPSSRCQRPNSHRRGRCFAHRCGVPFWSADADRHSAGRTVARKEILPAGIGRHIQVLPVAGRGDVPSCRERKAQRLHQMQAGAGDHAGTGRFARIGRNLGAYSTILNMNLLGSERKTTTKGTFVVVWQLHRRKNARLDKPRRGASRSGRHRGRR